MSYRKRHIKSKIHRRKPATPIFARPVFWLVFLFLIVALIVGYFLFFYEGLKVKSISVFGNERVLSQDLQSFTTGLINEKINNIVLINKENIKQSLLKKFSNIEDVKISKDFPQTIKLEVRERQRFGIFCDEQCYFIDKNGVIFEQVLDVPPNLIILRRVVSDRQVFTGEEVVNKKLMDLILKIENNLIDNFKIDIESVFIAGVERLDIKTTESWQIYFDIGAESDINLEIAKLNALLAEELTPDQRNNLQYIDLRFKDRAYYK